MAEPSTVIPRLHRALTASANAAGGWPYYPRKLSRIEPTAWALVALADTWTDDAAAWQRFLAPHAQWLTASQRRDGLLVDSGDAPPNLTANGLAACVLAHLDTSLSNPQSAVNPQSPIPNPQSIRNPQSAIRNVLPPLVDGIAAVKGVSVQLTDGRQDNRLQGWPWLDGTFSWLEPTCWGVLALKKAGANVRTARARIDEAERLIADRSCNPGGWNFGNASAIGQDLRPYVPTSALGLMALQDRRDRPVVPRALAWLEGARMKEPSVIAMSLASVCLRIYGKPTADVDAAIAADMDRAERMGSIQALAMMLYAISADSHQVRAFHV